MKENIPTGGHGTTSAKARPFLLWLGIIIIFSKQCTEDPTELSYQTVNFTIHSAEQLRIIPDRAWEQIDVIHNFSGIFIGFIVYGIVRGGVLIYLSLSSKKAYR